MKEAYLAGLAVIAAALMLYSWGGPPDAQGEGFATARPRMNCRRPSPPWSERPDDAERPEYYATVTRGTTTTAFRSAP